MCYGLVEDWLRVKDWEGKSCKILFKKFDGEFSFYTVKVVKQVTDTHISFIDRDDVYHTVAIERVVEIYGSREGVRA